MRHWILAHSLVLCVLFPGGVLQASSNGPWHKGLPQEVGSALAAEKGTAETKILKGRFVTEDHCFEFQLEKSSGENNTFALLRYRVMPRQVNDELEVCTWQPEKLLWITVNEPHGFVDRRFALVRVRQKKYGKSRHGWRWQELPPGSPEYAAEEKIILQIVDKAEQLRRERGYND